MENKKTTTKETAKPSLNPNYKVASKEKIYFTLMVATSMITLICFAVFGRLMLVSHNEKVQVMFSWIVNYSLLGLLLIVGTLISFTGSIKGNGVKVTAKQFPQIYATLCAQAKVLKFKHLPDTYIMEGHGVLQAFALRFFMRNYVVLTSRIIEVARINGNEEAVAFIIGHELGHHKRGHTSFIVFLLNILSCWVPFLGNAYSRACEYTCDSIGHSLASAGSKMGLLALAAGNLAKEVDLEEFFATTKKDKGFATWFSSIFSSHPHLADRLKKLSLQA